MSQPAYEPPRVLEQRRIEDSHLRELAASRIDVLTAGLAGVSTIEHRTAFDIGIRAGAAELRGLAFRYWDPTRGRFSDRFIRLKPDARLEGRKYLQPVGERPRLYFIPGTTLQILSDTGVPILVVEGEKKALALARDAAELPIPAVVIGIGGVWSWRCSPRELRPDGALGKGKSRAIEDLDLIAWRGREVYLLFDSDVTTNWKVEAAETALARELHGRGAVVRIIRLQGRP